jgi:hypothetical protein
MTTLPLAAPAPKCSKASSARQHRPENWRCAAHGTGCSDQARRAQSRCRQLLPAPDLTGITTDLVAPAGALVYAESWQAPPPSGPSVRTDQFDKIISDVKVDNPANANAPFANLSSAGRFPLGGSVRH